MKRMTILSAVLLTAAGGAALAYEALAAEEPGYRQLVELSGGMEANELAVSNGQVVAVLENRFEAEAIASYDADGGELWRQELNGAHYAIGDQEFVMVSGNEVAVHKLSDGTKTGAFPLSPEFRMSGSGASVSIEAGHVLVTGNLGARLWVHELDGTLAADVSGNNVHEATITDGHLLYLDGAALHGSLLSGGKAWQAPGVMEPYASANGIVYYIKGTNEEAETPVLIARELESGKVQYEKKLPADEEVRLAGTDDEGAVLEFSTSGERVFVDAGGVERLRKPIRSAAFQSLENRYRPVVTEYELGHEQQEDHYLLMLREQGTSAFGNPYELGALQVMGRDGGFEKVLEHPVEAAVLSPSGGAAVLGGGLLKFYDPSGNQTAAETVPAGSDRLAVEGEAVYVYGGSGIAAYEGEPEPKASAVQKISGQDRYETAALLSAAVWDSADTVVIATGEHFADALSGAPLAYQEGGPLLFTEKDRLNAATKAEIERLGATKAIILGSSQVIVDAQLEQLSSMGVETERIGGLNRYETAALVSDRIVSDGAVVADGMTFKDVSQASVFAAQQRYPILLSQGNRMPRETTQAMAGRSDIVLAGDRLSIETRMNDEEPARKIAVLAAASSFTDSLAGANAAARRNGTLHLIGDNGLTKELLERLEDYESFLVVDSQGAVDAESVRSLEALVD